MKDYGDKERREDFDFFIEHYQEFYRKYGHSFLVIKEQKVIGCYDSENTAIKETIKVWPLGTFIVQECNGDESAYTNYISSWQIIQI
ncbi:MAG: hypothetical protein LIP12_18485 [Clostridiales bacterium]|nr:hypothetical protein [Clostridiales bacterium]MCD7882277.1 hypothetical protein [Lachnospiraceae bacterium]MCD7956932.1 hypothetical protein [Lachnospiraceae bacterium]